MTVLEFRRGIQQTLDVPVPPAPREDDRPLCCKCLRVSSILAEGRFYCGSCALDEWGAFFFDGVLG